MTDQVPMYAWAAAVALAVLAGGWTARSRPEIRPTLPLEHVAGATLIAVNGWEMLVTLPGSVMGFWTLTAGLGDVRGVEGPQAFVVAQALFVGAAAFAIVGILRRRTWGAVLGIGLAAAVVLWRVLGLISTFQQFGSSMDGGNAFSFFVNAIGMGAIPALAAAVLLGLPLWQRTAPPAEAEWGREPAGAERTT